MDDNLALKRAQKGDPAAFEALIAPHEKHIYQICLRMTGNPDDAQDACQEAFLRIYRHISSFKGESQFSTWVYRVATNACLDELRKRNSRSAASVEKLSEMGVMVEESCDGPEATVLQREQAEGIRRAILSLPEDQRVALVLRDVRGHSYDEIASILELNLNTVKSRISRARMSMSKFLSGQTENAELFSARGV